MKKLIALFSLSVFFLAACQPVDPPNGQNDPLAQDTVTISDLNVCEIYTEELITSIIGEPYNTNSINFAEETPACKFINTEDDELNARNFNMIVRRTPDEETAEKEYQQAIAVWRNGNIPEESEREFFDLDDIGTKAFWTPGSATSQLIMYEGNNLLILTLGHLDLTEEELLETARTIIDATLPALS